MGEMKLPRMDRIHDDMPGMRWLQTTFDMQSGCATETVLEHTANTFLGWVVVDGREQCVFNTVPTTGRFIPVESP